MNATRPRVLIVPTLNEAVSIAACLDALMALHDCDVLVIDDDSPDGTADVARDWAGERPGVHVVVRQDAAARPGLGPALRHGFDVAAALGYRAACVFDADLQQRPSDARRLLDAVEAGADVAVGMRAMGEGSGATADVRATSPLRVGARDRGAQFAWSSRAASALLRRWFDVPWRDATTDFMALRLATWSPELSAAVQARGLFAAFEIRWRIARAGGTVVELAVPCRPRTAGRAHGGVRRTVGWAVEVVALKREMGRAKEDIASRSRASIGAAASAVLTGEVQLGAPSPDDDTPGPARVARLVASGAPLMLHLACGKRHIPGWVHVDVDDWPHVDLVQTVERLPLPDASAALIYNCHQIAYYDRVTVLDVLAEWRRVLRPGGLLRISTADFEAVAAEYALGRPLESFDGLLHGRYPVRASSARRLDVVRIAMSADEPGTRDVSGGAAVPIYYRTTYDFRTLSAALRQAGFEDVQRYDWRNTEHADVDDYAQAYLPHMDKERGRLMSLNVGARKPVP